MPTFEITAPDGHVYHIDGPEGATEQDALKQLQSTLTSAPEAAPSAAMPAPERKLSLGDRVMRTATDVASGANVGLMKGVGGVVDLANAALSPIGLGSEEPVGGSKFLQRNLAKIGVGYSPETQPNTAQTIGEVGGQVAGALALPGVTPATTMAGRIGQNAAVGGASGAVAAAGDSSGLPAKDRLKAITLGAVTGLLTGGTLGGASEGVSKGVGALTRGAKQAFGPSEEKAAAVIRRALTREGATPGSVADRVAEANQAGVPMRPLDIGPSTQGVARALETQPGRAGVEISNALKERSADQPSRVASKVGTLFGDATDYADAAKTVMARQAENTGPAYARAYQDSVTLTPSMKALMDRPSIKSAIGKAVKIAQEEGDDAAAAKLGTLTSDALTRQQKLPVKLGDYIKRGLDDVIEESRDPITGKLVLDTAARAAQGTRTQWRHALTNEVSGSPAYAKALGEFGDDASLLEAGRLGQGLFKGETDKVLTRFRGMTDAQKEMFRLGAGKTITDLIDKSKDGHDVVAKFFGSPDMRLRLRGLFDNNNEFQAFEGQMRLERALTKPYAGSQTQVLRAGQDELANDLGAEIAHAFVRGRPVSGTAAALAARMKTFGLDEKASGLVADWLLGRATGKTIEGKALLQLSRMAESDAKVRAATQAAARAEGLAAGAGSAELTK